MAEEAKRHIADMTGPLAIPRQNGEPTFQSPWEARAFGIAVVLSEQDVYAWRDFSQSLAAQIAHAEQYGMDSGYYERWYAALEQLVTSRGIITQEEIDQRATAYASDHHDNHGDHHHH
ncbi:MAG: nitrile hydratase accessory protein [Candidatus Tectomicrobia bacterium]|nr:nitrile hydratase accessory protein [Candidatus Tectomicrobia bacterium]